MGFEIFLSPPHMGGKEMEYIKEAFDTNWIAPCGPSLNAFENEMASYIGVESALALSSGTAAIHLALRWCGVQQGDYVFCQDFTFIGSCEPILYQKAIPVFVDSENKSWNMSPIALENAFKMAKKNNRMPKAVIICDLYGESADWDNLLPICKRFGVPVIEDAAEAVGAIYKGKKCGSFGNIGILSFNGNKIITTSGGGMVLSNDTMAIRKMRFWSTQAREPAICYEHNEYGYNYRMSNICAAIGRGQLEFLPQKLEMRKRIHNVYINAVECLPANIKRITEQDSSNHWLNLLFTESDTPSPAEIVILLQKSQIEARPAWKPMHMQPLFKDEIFVTDKKVHEYSIDCVGKGDVLDEEIFNHTICLPSGDTLTVELIEEIVDKIKHAFCINNASLPKYTGLNLKATNK